MRLFNPEWEAIKEFEHTAKVRDAQFDLAGSELAEDHGQALFDSLTRLAPWLAGSDKSGIHPIHGAASGRGTLVINRRAKLVLRLPLALLDAAKDLCGQSIDLGCGPIRIGDLKIKPLQPFGYLYAPFVDMGTADEERFLELAAAQLEKMGVQAGLIPGKPRKMLVPDGEVVGYSLMLHDVTLANSILIQEQGLGWNRLKGCGLFVPHKSIKEVTAG
jgi:CRISPR-associated protein Cas6